MAVRVKQAGRKASSKAWLERQLRDPYVAAARRDGWRSRAAFKLIELDDRFHLLQRGHRVVDLGAAPGGWTQVAAARTGAEKGRGIVVGLDLAEIVPIPGAILLRGDLREPNSADMVRAALGGQADLVLSDMAAPATGHAATDHLRIVALAEAAFDFAASVLAPGSSFVVKVFQGGAEGVLLAELKRAFTELRHVKPKASRAESAETYLLARGYRGRA
ncbi:MAG TPA: RlmE family RNA methyltransferase [Stellaceae bacterium]|nr:RlmE family RNA methyltransferase [Stellaceae bacterium]